MRNFWKFTSCCSLKPLWSGMGEVVPARTSPTLPSPSPPTVHQSSWLALKSLKSDNYWPVVFPGIGHTPIEQSHLPWENSAHTSYKHTSSLSHSGHNFCPPGTCHCSVDKGSMEWEVCPTLLHMTHSRNCIPDLLILTLTVLAATIDAQREGMGDVGSARYEPALLPPCPTIRVLSYSNW